MTKKQVLKAALELGPEERREIADTLNASIQSLEEPPVMVGNDFAAEMVQRYQEALTHREVGLPMFE